MNYYIQDENEKIVLFDTDLKRITNTREFMSQYADLEIQQTDREIILLDNEFVFADEHQEEIAQKERERISNLEISQEKFWNFMLPITKQDAITKIKDIPEIGKKMLIEIDNPTYKRSSIIICGIAGIYNITDEILDNLFQE